MAYPDAPQGTDARQYPQSPDAMPTAEPKNGFALAAMVVGIVSLLSAAVVWFLAIPVGIIAIVLGIVALGEARKRDGQGRGPAIAGIVCGAITVVLGLVFLGLMVLVVATGHSS